MGNFFLESVVDLHSTHEEGKESWKENACQQSKGLWSMGGAFSVSELTYFKL